MEIQETEKIGTDEKAVCDLIATLKQIDAPGDFNFRVRARIADGKPAATYIGWFPASTRVAVPLALVLMAGGYFGLSSYYQPDESLVSSVAVPQNPDTLPPIEPVASGPVVATDISTVSSAVRADDARTESLVRPSGNVGPTRVFPRTPARSAGSGSYDEAAREVRKIYPRGFNPSPQTPANGLGSGTELTMSAKDLLTVIGIAAAFDGTGWKASSVGNGSLAGRSGIRAGDLIEAVDGQTLVRDTVFSNRFNGKSLRIRRDGKTMQIDLKN